MSELAWIEERVPGDPKFVRLMCAGEVAMPAPTTARARWEARQAALYGNKCVRARMLLPVLNQLIDETGSRFLSLTVGELREALKLMAGEER